MLCLTVSWWRIHLWCCTEWKRRVFTLSERMGIVRVTHTCLPCSLKCKQHHCLSLYLCIFCLLHCFFCSALREHYHQDTSWPTDCFCTKQHLCMHVVVWTIMWPQNTLLWYVCQHLCRALFLITSISICRITNKCITPAFVCLVFPALHVRWWL